MKLLTRTTKMACSSWSLPAGPDVCAAFMRGDRSVCESCYAAQGMYYMPNVRNAQANRLHAWRFGSDIDERLIKAINRTRSRYFRVFDSGDFSEVGDIVRWTDICRACPTKLFWIPTRVWRFGGAWTVALRQLHALPNVCVRYSGLRWDEEPSCNAYHSGLITGIHDTTHPAVTMVTDGSGNCPATQKHSSCKTERCRKCWSKGNLETRIDRHGRNVNWNRRLNNGTT